MAQPERSLDAMRQDAIRRSREMQRRAMPSAPPEPEPVEQKAPSAPPLTGELGELLTHWDTEKLAVAGLLWLLWKEGADLPLLLALAYILL